MPNKKIFILLPDGIGLRNFAFSNFYKIGIEKDFEIKYWNNTPFDLTTLGFDEVKIHKAKSNLLTDVYKNARKHIELNLNSIAENDSIYNSYRFPLSYKNVKAITKSLFTEFLILTHSSSKGLEKIRLKIKNAERKTSYYQHCLKTLKAEKPSMVFCTNQRPVLAIAPLLAAQDLKIPTATFIFSWDNLPKATMVVETDFYFVWSEHMKKELLHYYSYVDEKQIFIVGTPQFETHFNKCKVIEKAQFYSQYQLDLNKKYICYSGDDITTSPNDPDYLLDVAKAVRLLNNEGYSLGIIFRRCPVDFSSRFDAVLKENKDIITAIAPSWKKIGEGWNTVLPTQADVELQINTIEHTEMVINLGSSMVFDYVCFQKPCGFVNYNPAQKKNADWSVFKIYNYIHFRSMPNDKSVLWVNSPEEIAQTILIGLNNPSETIENAQKWFEKINQHPPELASERIWEGIQKILK